MTKIALLGDISFTGKFSLTENHDVKELFLPIKNAVKDCDIVVGNLESPFVENSIPVKYKSTSLNSEPINVELLNYLGINLVNLANNHILDYGIDGLNETIDILENNGIEWFGCYGKQYIPEKCRLAFLGYCSYNTNQCSERYNSEIKGSLNLLHYSNVINVMENNSRVGLINILSVHSGIENAFLPSLEDRKFAEKLSTKFDYIYYGHHPHVLQGYEKINNSFAFYSLGNFCFADVIDKLTGKPIVSQSKLNNESAIIFIDIDDNIVTKYKVVTFSYDDEKFNLFDYKVEENLQKYCDYFKLDEKEYLSVRNEQVAIANKKLKASRGLKWLLARLNINTALRILEVKENSRNYKDYFYSKVNKNG